MCDKTLAIVRPFGRHTIGISVNEKYSPLKSIKYIGSDINSIDWSWLNLEKTELISVRTRQVRLHKTLWAGIDGLSSHLRDVDFIDTGELYNFYSYQCARTSKDLKKPLIVTVIETISRHITSLIPPYCFNTKYVAQNADLIVPLTNRAKEYLLSLSINESKIKMIRQGIDLERFALGKIEHSKVRILIVSVLVDSRGIRELLQAFRNLCRSLRDVELWVCGNGPLQSLVKAYATKLPIRLINHIHYRDMPELYKQCDVFVMPGKDTRRFGIKIQEDGQYTISLLEAMASGLPAVVSNSGAYPEIVGSCNIVVGQGSINQLGRALSILVEDEKKRLCIGRENRKRMEQFFNGKKQCEMYAKEIMKLE